MQGQQPPHRADWTPDVKPGDPLPVPCEGTPEQCTRSHAHSVDPGAGSASVADVHFAKPGEPGVHKHGDLVPDLKPGDKPLYECAGSIEQCTRSHTRPQEPHTIALVLETDPRFTVIKKAIHTANLLQELRAPGPYTLFAPTDSAYSPPRMNESTDAIEFQERVVTLEYVQNHCIPGKKLTTKDLQGMDKIDLHHVKAVPINKKEGKIGIAHSVIEFGDIQCSNGVIHGMSHVLEPHAMRKMLHQHQI